MALISTANALAYGDRVGRSYEILLAQAGDKNAALAADGTLRGLMYALLGQVTGVADFHQQRDLDDAVNTAVTKGAAQNLGTYLGPVIDALTTHLANLGPSVAAAIVDLPSFASYYNGGAGGAKFSAMFTPYFAQACKDLKSITLPPAGVMSPALNPDFNAAVAQGMGTKSAAGVFTAGNAVDTTLYSEVIPVLEVTVTFVGGSAPPTATIAGLDDNGAAATWGPVTLTGGNNPAPLTGITITPAVNAAARQTVAFSSATGVVVGSVLTINKNKPDQEVVIVEAVAGANVTAAFFKAHGAGATVDGPTCTAAGNASTGAGRRLRSVTSITLGLTGHSAGTVRVGGAQDRRNV